MKIVTTPMCEEIVKLAGISNYKVNKNPDEEDGDLAILLSESKVDMDSIHIKLNTSSQIFKSIKIVSELSQNMLSDGEIYSFFEDYTLCKKYLNASLKNNINVKVYSEFLKDIVLDMGFNIVFKDFDYVVFPDYLKQEVKEHENLIEMPSHGVVSKNPFKRIESRYAILENLI